MNICKTQIHFSVDKESMCSLAALRLVQVCSFALTEMRIVGLSDGALIS